MLNMHRFFLFLLCFFAVNRVEGQICDNPNLPLYPHTYSRTMEKGSNVITDVEIFTANDAFAKREGNCGIFEVLGIYNQMQVANALVALGFSNPLLPEFAILVEQERPIPWIMRGKIQAQSLSFAYNQRVFQRCFDSNSFDCSFGFSWFFMHSFSYINFSMSAEQQRGLGLSDSELADLDRIRREMNIESGLEAPTSTQAGLSDIDFYIRCGGLWDYFLKFKHIDAGIRFGLLINSGVTRDINNPASIPFGGDGFFGIYCANDIELEIREDWKFGWLTRLNVRFGKTSQERISLENEQPLFGVTTGNVYVEPGPTFIFAPYFSVEDIRDGLGVQMNYTLVWHLDDLWRDERIVKSPPATLQEINNVTSWVAEYLTVNLFYDFSKVRREMCDAPKLWCRWDLPIRVAAAERISKTNRISCGMIFSF